MDYKSEFSFHLRFPFQFDRIPFTKEIRNGTWKEKTI